MKRAVKFFLVCLFLFTLLNVFHPPAMAQVQDSLLWLVPSFNFQPLVVPTGSDTDGDGAFDHILVDNFEYWDSPYNHGWRQEEPGYPTYGFGIGYAQIFNTIPDLQDGSRVLDVFRQSSIFLLGGNYEQHHITKGLFTPPPPGKSGASFSEGISLASDGYPVVSFKFRAPLGIESWDIFGFEVWGSTLGKDNTPGTGDDGAFVIRIRPVPPPYRDIVTGPGHTSENMYDYQATLLQQGDIPGMTPMVIHVNIGRGFLDGAWHVVSINLQEVNEKAHAPGHVPSDWTLSMAFEIRLSGQMFRLDDIIFKKKEYNRLNPPDLFEPGPRYAQLFEPYRHLFMADYEADGEITRMTDLLLDPNNFITDPDRIRDTWMSDLLHLDPNYHVIDPNHFLYNPDYTNRWLHGDPDFGKPDPVARIYMQDDFFVDTTLPIFSDQNFRISSGRVAELRNHGALGWNLTVGGYGQNAIQALPIKPLPINPYDGMPTYIPAFYVSHLFEIIKTYGRPHFGPAQCFILESALWNTGIPLWANIACVDFTPQYFEDLIMTIEVTNGIRSDVRTFPMSVVNYPVENYPPVLQLNICPSLFYVGQSNKCSVRFIDPDSFIFSLAQFEGRQPATSHLPGWPYNEDSPFESKNIRTDQDQLIYRISLEGLDAYQYGPWVDTAIDPYTGLISFIPWFEGLLQAIVTCTDNRGGVAVGMKPIPCVNTGTWLNHPPILFRKPTEPVVVKAGEEAILTPPNLQVTDPDGDQLYAACNIGSVGRTADGAFIWTFQSNFPGSYHVELIFYDIRGGYLIIRLPLEVKPWWSY